ncbi:outer dense fiber protein 4 isoform X8 [Macaca thibetana thibetana]|uniref:outer dense fiber protein 4 isoform X8 n=1 Tax=Macaca thibetana thibetana TaxID=257877 RepID=UPI0021BC6D34|nr:outer dense fiber protein 4 isoform X8 [Macaca thibetana thibetana]
MDAEDPGNEFPRSEGERDQHQRPEKETKSGEAGWGRVTFIFFTLMLFPINIWIFEVERNVSIPIGWSYFIGWLVLILYVSCAILCYFNYKSFWSLILSHPSSTVSCSSSFASAEESPRAQMITDTPITQEGVLDPERKDTHL